MHGNWIQAQAAYDHFISREGQREECKARLGANRTTAIPHVAREVNQSRWPPASGAEGGGLRAIAAATATAAAALVASHPAALAAAGRAAPPPARWPSPAWTSTASCSPPSASASRSTATYSSCTWSATKSVPLRTWHPSATSRACTCRWVRVGGWDVVHLTTTSSCFWTRQPDVHMGCAGAAPAHVRR